MPAIPLIVAHRGASADAPENTLAAFRLAFEQGGDAIEGDFHLTADGQVVCIHDDTTKRCGDRDLTVAISTLADLRTADVGSWKSPNHRGERVPTLAEVLAVVPPGKMAFLELKTGLAIVPAVRTVIATSGLSAAQVLLMSFDAEVVAACKQAMPAIAADWLTDWHDPRPTVDDVIKTAKACHADGVGVEGDPAAVTADFVSRMNASGLAVRVWTVDDAELASEFARRGVAAVTTNRPGEIRRIQR